MIAPVATKIPCTLQCCFPADDFSKIESLNVSFSIRIVALLNRSVFRIVYTRAGG